MRNKYNGADNKKSYPIIHLKKCENMTPLVSILVPTYNHERYIGQCIESVLAQTFPNWEMLIIDDGSTDETPNVVSRYKRDNRIRYFRQKHVGIWKLFKTYNSALKLARGRYIAILEGDDCWPPYKLKEQIRDLDNEDVVLTWGKFAMINEEGEILGVYPKGNILTNIYRNKPKGKILGKLLLENFIQPSTVICRRNALVSIGGFKQPPGAPYADYLTWLELSLVGGFSTSDRVLGYWRRHSAQVTSTIMGTVERQMARNKFLERFFDRLPPEIRNLSGISAKTLRTANRENLAWVYLGMGIKNLFNQRWGSARQYFTMAISKGTPPTKLKAFLGLTFSYAKMDLKPATAIIKRSALKTTLGIFGL